MNILVTGGAGYIGSFMVKRLIDESHEVTVIDSFERGDKLPSDSVPVKKGSLLDSSFLKSVFQESKFDAVVHFAGYISVKESTEQVGLYFENNVQATVNLLDEMVNAGVETMVFSSSAAVYGNPLKIPIPEDHPKNPESPYGESKLMVEKILYWYQKIKGISSVSLRYFNASGAALDGTLGENHNPETHIIPSAISAALHETPFILYGNDYPTDDGTCVRDYIHVLDLVEAHILSLKKLKATKGVYQYNLGTGKGYSNKQIIEEVEKVSGKKMQIEIAARRPGDPAVLVADPKKSAIELSFTPKYSDLPTIVSSAYKWHSKRSL